MAAPISCGACARIASDGVITSCSHVICDACVAKSARGGGGGKLRCSVCGRDGVRTMSLRKMQSHSKHRDLFADPMTLLARAKEAHSFQSTNALRALELLRRKNEQLRQDLATSQQRQQEQQEQQQQQQQQQRGSEHFFAESDAQRDHRAERTSIFVHSETRASSASRSRSGDSRVGYDRVLVPSATAARREEWSSAGNNSGAPPPTRDAQPPSHSRLFSARPPSTRPPSTRLPSARPPSARPAFVPQSPRSARPASSTRPFSSRSSRPHSSSSIRPQSSRPPPSPSAYTQRILSMDRGHARPPSAAIRKGTLLHSRSIVTSPAPSASAAAAVGRTTSKAVSSPSSLAAARRGSDKHAYQRLAQTSVPPRASAAVAPPPKDPPPATWQEDQREWQEAQAAQRNPSSSGAAARAQPAPQPSSSARKDAPLVRSGARSSTRTLKLKRPSTAQRASTAPVRKQGRHASGFMPLKRSARRF